MPIPIEDALMHVEFETLKSTIRLVLGLLRKQEKKLREEYDSIEAMKFDDPGEKCLYENHVIESYQRLISENSENILRSLFIMISNFLENQLRIFLIDKEAIQPNNFVNMKRYLNLVMEEIYLDETDKEKWDRETNEISNFFQIVRNSIIHRGGFIVMESEKRIFIRNLIKGIKKGSRGKNKSHTHNFI